MDNFDLKPDPKKFNWKSTVWNILTLVVVLGICFVAYFFLNIFINPHTPFNPFPPAALPTLYQTVTPTEHPRRPYPGVHLDSHFDYQAATHTYHRIHLDIAASDWSLSLRHLVASDTPTGTIATGTATPMPASANITYIASTDYHPDLEL